MFKFKKIEWFYLVLILLAAAGWKAYLLGLEVFPFNADEAVVGLMARHIQQGNIPIFFYGQAYMGSLDALLVSGLFNLIGQKIVAIRLIQAGLYLLTIITTVEIGRVGFRSTNIGLVAAILMGVPVVNTTLYTTVSLGGYGETLLIGNLIILVGLRIIHCYQSLNIGNSSEDDVIQNTFNNRLWIWFLGLGFLIGAGFWADGLTLVYSIPVIVLIIGFGIMNRQFKSHKSWIIPVISLIMGLNLGAFACWIFVFQNGLPQLIKELTGSAVDVNQLPFLQAIWERITNFLLLGMSAFLGLRPPWQVYWLVLPMIPYVLLFWAWIITGTIMLMITDEECRATYWILISIGITLFTGFILSPFGNDPSGRYLLPMTVPFMLLAGRVLVKFIKGKVWRGILVMALLVFNIFGTLQCAAQNPPGITTQFDSISIIDKRMDEELIRFLKENREMAGYTNYWVAYPLAFKSEEKIIFTPSLPYHQDFRYTKRDNRYEPYSDIVALSQTVAYITTNHPDLDQYLRKKFTQINVTWKEHQIGNYHLFYQLSKPVRPEDIGLGGD